MTWLIAFLISNAPAIGAIGAAAYAINQVEQVAVTTMHIVKDAKDEK